MKRLHVHHLTDSTMYHRVTGEPLGHDSIMTYIKGDSRTYETVMKNNPKLKDPAKIIRAIAEIDTEKDIKKKDVTFGPIFFEAHGYISRVYLKKIKIK